MGLTDSVIHEAYLEGIELGLDSEELDEFVEGAYLDILFD